jgi:FkbM family methyltransferase
VELPIGPASACHSFSFECLRNVISFLEDRLETWVGLTITGYIYIDVGANHPTLISDTYLFYRSGYSGVCFEPNAELADVFAKFRPRDKVIPAAVSSTRGLLKFYVTQDSVLSSLSVQDLEEQVAFVRLAPVVVLDDLLISHDFPGIFLLKVDTEGYDTEVLKGATKLLHRTLLVLTETFRENDLQECTRILGNGWEKVSSGANTLFVNQLLMAQCQNKK